MQRLSTPKIECIDAIISIVAEYYGIEPKMIFGHKGKTEPQASARKLSCHFIYEYMGGSSYLNAISAYLGRDHTAILFHHQDMSARLRVYRSGMDDVACEDYYRIKEAIPPELTAKFKEFKPQTKVIDRMAEMKEVNGYHHQEEKKPTARMTQAQKIDAIYAMLKELSSQNGHSKTQ